MQAPKLLRGTLITVLLAGAPAAVLAQGTPVEDLSRTISVSHGGDFFRDRIEVDGTLKNNSDRDFSCIMLVFEIADGSDRTHHPLYSYNIAPRTQAFFKGRLPPGDSIRHVTTMSCPASVEVLQQANCTISGVLGSRNDFQVKAKSGKKTVATIALYDGAELIHRTRLRKSGGRATYAFKPVSAGREYRLHIGDGWLLDGGGFKPILCQRGQKKHSVPGIMVTYDFDYDY